MSPENQALLEKYPQYYRSVAHLEVIDVYRVIQLFNVTDATAQHALKKLLLSGSRTGGKSIETDLKEARDTLTRGLAMRAEDDPQLKLEPKLEVTVTTRGTDVTLGGFGVGVDEPAKFCAAPNCMMRARGGDHCMMHAVPQEKPAPVIMCAEPNCVMLPVDGSIMCAEHKAPKKRELRTPTITVPPGPSAPPSRCR